MADNVAITAGTGTTIAADEVSDGTLGSVKVQYVKLMDGTLDGTTKGIIGANGLYVDVRTAVLPTGAATETTLGTLLTQSDFDTKIGSLTETAPASDTASSGLNGRLQRIAQRITSLIALVPTALTGSGNFKVSIAESSATVTVDSELPTAAALADGASNPTAPMVGANNLVWNGTTWDRLKGDTTNGAYVNVKTSVLPTGASTETTLATMLTQSDFDTKVGSLTESAPASDTASSGLNGRLQRIAQRITSLIALVPTALTGSGNFKAALVESTATVTVTGDVAHDSADSGNPLKVGGKATSSEPTAVASGDRTNFITDLVGKLITLPYANPENFVSGAITTAMTGTTSTSLVAAPGAGLRNYITTIVVSNAHATVGTDIVIQDGSGGTTLLTIPAAAVYGGAVLTLPTPLRQPTANTALYCANVTTGASTKVSAIGYKGA